MWNQGIRNYGLGNFWCCQIWPWAPPSRSNEGSQSENCLQLAYWWKMLFIFKTSMLVGLFRWIHLASGHRCVLGLVENAFYLRIYVGCSFPVDTFCIWPQMHPLQGVSSHGKPGKVMEFHFLFPGLEKSWKLTPGFGKFIKRHGN